MRAKRGNFPHLSLRGIMGFIRFARNRLGKLVPLSMWAERGNLAYLSLRTKCGNLIRNNLKSKYKPEISDSTVRRLS